MARCGCGGACSCALTAGDNITVGGSGTAANPWVINAVTNCVEVRQCLTNGCGITYNNTTGAISADISEDANNALQCRPNGLYVQSGAATVSTGCGLNGNGSVGDPVVIDTAAWPFPCDESLGQDVYCDPATNRIVTDPPVRQAFFQDAQNRTLPGTGIAVPGAADQVIDTVTLDVTNPDTCRPASIMVYFDVDIDLDLPPNSGGMYGMDGDDLVYLGNEGDGTIFSTHAQSSKMTRLTVAAGATLTITRTINAGRGTGGARIRRIQSAIRAWVYSQP